MSIHGYSTGEGEVMRLPYQHYKDELKKQKNRRHTKYHNNK
jgi:hypothetical protein